MVARSQLPDPKRCQATALHNLIRATRRTGGGNLFGVLQLAGGTPTLPCFARATAQSKAPTWQPGGALRNGGYFFGGLSQVVADEGAFVGAEVDPAGGDGVLGEDFVVGYGVLFLEGDALAYLF